MSNMTPAELAAVIAANPDIYLDDPDDLRALRSPRAPAQTEAQLQQAVFAEAERRALDDPRWGLLVPIVNGQYRRGQRPEPGLSRAAGLPDLMLPLASRGYAGAWVELKVGRNVLSEKQKAWHRTLREHGHFVSVVYDDPQTVISIIDWYLEGAGE